ncbi:MAG: 3-deoxy-8-phosphooctulonate synthase [Candidatus Firestonebacteria bacterium]
MKEINIGKIEIGDRSPLVLIAGPCVIENEKQTLAIANEIKKIVYKLKIPFIFKASYIKSNRTAVENYEGPGIKKGLKILAKVKKEFDIPVLSDVHCKEEVAEAAQVLDVIQIPAYLSQQTNLTLAIAKTGRVVNVKKGQFLSPWDIAKIVKKIESTGNNKILITERGTVFGYNNLVVDMRSFAIMKNTGYPVIFDVTHAIRLPGITSSNMTGGQPELIYPLARAGVAAGCNAIFIETHPKPQKALCDASSMLPLNKLYPLLKQLRDIHNYLKTS